MTKRNVIPNVPGKIEPELRQFLEATREVLQVYSGNRGHALDKAVTFRDLKTVSDQLKQLRAGIDGLSGVGGPGGKTPESYDTPTEVIGLRAAGGFGAITVSWNGADFKGYQFTRLYASETDDFSTAGIIMESATVLFMDLVGDRATRFYWAQHVGSAYEVQEGATKTVEVDGPLSTSVNAVTMANYEDLRAEISDQLLGQIEAIENSFQQAVDRIDSLFGSGSGSLDDVLNLLTSVQSRAARSLQQYSEISKYLLDMELSVHRERLDRATDIAFTQRRVSETISELRTTASTLDVVYSDMYSPSGLFSSTVIELNETIATLDSATATKFVEVSAALEGVDYNLSASISELSQTVVNLDSATSLRFSTVESEINSNKSSITTLNSSVSTLNSATADLGSQLSAEVTNRNNAINTAKATVLSSVAANENNVVSGTIDSYQVNVPGTGWSTLHQLAQVSGDATTGNFQSLWGVKTQVGTATAGVSIYNDGVKTSFIVNAQQFAIHDNSADAMKVPFSFQYAWVSSQGFVWSTEQNNYPPTVTSPAGNATWQWKQTLILENAYIKQAAIVDLIAKNITVNNIDAKGRINAGFFHGGVLQLENLNGVSPLFTARNTINGENNRKTIEIDPGDNIFFWFGDGYGVDSIVTYDPATLVPTVSRRSKSLDNASFALSNNGQVVIRQTSGDYACLHNPNSTFFMWFGRKADSAAPTYANAVWYLDNLGRYPTPIVSKTAIGEIGYGGSWGQTVAVSHLSLGQPIDITVDITGSYQYQMISGGTPGSGTWTLTVEIYSGPTLIKSQSFPIKYTAYNVSGEGTFYDATVVASTFVTTTQGAQQLNISTRARLTSSGGSNDFGVDLRLRTFEVRNV
jgi:hypothetical protein